MEALFVISNRINDRITTNFANFGSCFKLRRPITPRGWLRSARNFVKTRFSIFPFHLSTPIFLFDEVFGTKNSSTMAPIGAKLWENAFQTIPDVRFFDVEKKIDEFFSIENFVFGRFGQVLEALGLNGPQNHLRNQILLQIHPS